MPRKGDILIWHGDLAHGGRPVVDAETTRRSVVGHFCPASAEPHYFQRLLFRPKIRTAGQLRYVSGHYNLWEKRAVAVRRWLGHMLGR